MPIYTTAPGGISGPLEQTRTFGVWLKLTELAFIEGKVSLPRDIEMLGEALKQEWITCANQQLVEWPTNTGKQSNACRG
jgi:hypothetical protein